MGSNAGNYGFDDDVDDDDEGYNGDIGQKNRR
jgi:hypothetical protein